MENDSKILVEEKDNWAKKSNVAKAKKFQTSFGNDLDVLYTPADILEIDYSKDLGFPGQFPFTRGVYPLMYRQRPWDIRQYAGFGSPEDTNHRWKKLLSHGQRSLSLACDLSTQLGYDSDDPEIEDEVGRVGCAIDSLRDMEILFEGLPMNRLPTSFNMNSQAALILAMYIATAEKYGVKPSELSGTMANDILTEYVTRGTWIFPPKPSLRLATDVAEYCTKYMPRFYPFNLRGVLFCEAGGEISQEVGYLFSNACTHVEDLVSRGLEIDEFASKISFFFIVGTRIFEHVAKIRAARRLWARIIKERFGAKEEASMRMRCTVMHQASEFAAIEPELNLVRGAYGALAGALAGCQAMWLPAIDEHFAIPTEKTSRLAIMTQQVLIEETDALGTVDPLGGSYFIERLTSEIEKKIQERMKEVEKFGGSMEAIENGTLQKILADRAYRIQKEIEAGKRTVVGVNKYRVEERVKDMHFHEANPTALHIQIKRIKEVRAERDSASVSKSLEKLRKAAMGQENLMPYLIDATKAYATIGEVNQVLKEVFGEFREPVNI